MPEPAEAIRSRAVAEPTTAQPAPAEPGAVEEVRLPATGGVTLAVRVANRTGPHAPVLLVHGLASNARTWDGVADRLAAHGHPVAAVDQRGHGRSDKPDGGYDFATICADLVAVLDGLGWSAGVRRPVVAGQSWGGNVVLELAVRHPASVAAIGCVDGGTLELARRWPTWPACRAALTPPRLSGLTRDELARLVRAWHPGWSDAGVEATLANMEVRADGTITPWLALDHHLAILRHLWEHHPPQRWPLVGMPVLLIPSAMADADGVAAAQAALAGHLRVSPFPGADHDVHVQYPTEVADLLHDLALDAT
ncbi:MAG: alpha/beta fold hydrolase [Acidimicrobiales bacterium]